MKFLNSSFLILFILCHSPAVFSENLQLPDFYGTWIAKSTIVTGEKEKLFIRSDKSVTFSREFTHYPVQLFKIGNNKFYLVEDILILDFDENEHGSKYKLVLSGWKTEKTKRLYGILYMYEHGEQFNGISVTFEPENQVKSMESKIDDIGLEVYSEIEKNLMKEYQGSARSPRNKQKNKQ